MDRPTDFARQFVRDQNTAYRDRLQRTLAGTLTHDESRPPRLQVACHLQRPDSFCEGGAIKAAACFARAA
jgi:hypothetical protein